jgi:type IV secretory pathway TrbD component
MKARANPKFREMAMKKNLIPAAIILLATVWFALDAGVTALTLLS